MVIERRSTRSHCVENSLCHNTDCKNECMNLHFIDSVDLCGHHGQRLA